MNVTQFYITGTKGWCSKFSKWAFKTPARKSRVASLFEHGGFNPTWTIPALTLFEIRPQEPKNGNAFIEMSPVTTRLTFSNFFHCPPLPPYINTLPFHQAPSGAEGFSVEMNGGAWSVTTRLLSLKAVSPRHLDDCLEGGVDGLSF